MYSKRILGVISLLVFLALLASCTNNNGSRSGAIETTEDHKHSIVELAVPKTDFSDQDLKTQVADVPSVAQSGHAFPLKDKGLEFLEGRLEQTLLPLSGSVSLKLTITGQQLPETVRCYRAISNAAVIYALSTRDFEVTLQDLESAGYLPYYLDEFEGMKSFSISAKGANAVAGDASLESPILTGINTGHWKLQQKSRLLDFFHTEYYYQSPIDASHGDISGLRSSSFWINPIDGKPMLEGNQQGCFTLVPIEVLIPQFNKVESDSSIELEVPKIVWVDDVFSNGHVTSDEGLCCLFRREYSDEI